MIAYTPFIDPIDLHGAWFVLLIPLSLGIAVVWKAVRLPDEPAQSGKHVFPLRKYAVEVAVMTVQIILGMIGLGLLIYLIVQHAAPLLVPR